MTPAGQNYPIAEHSVVFWAVYLAVAIMTTIALMGLFLVMVGRSSNATRPAAPADVTPELDAGAAGAELHHTSAA